MREVVGDILANGVRQVLGKALQGGGAGGNGLHSKAHKGGLQAKKLGSDVAIHHYRAVSARRCRLPHASPTFFCGGQGDMLMKTMAGADAPM